MFPKQHFTVLLGTLICVVGPVDKSLKKTYLFTCTLLSITFESWSAVTGSRNVFVRGPIPTVQPFTAASPKLVSLIAVCHLHVNEFESKGVFQKTEVAGQTSHFENEI